MAADRVLAEFYNQLKIELLTELRKELAKENHAEPDKTLTASEAAPYIGVKIQTLYQMCTAKQIPHWRAGVTGSRKPNLLFSSVALDDWKRDEMKRNYQP